MKTYLFLLVALLLSTTGWAQIPPKRANAIIVTLPDSGVTAWKKASRALLAKGFVLKSSSKDLLSFASEPREVKSGTQVSISGLVTGYEVALSGTFIFSVVSKEAMSITYRGMDSSAFMISWQALDDFAKSLGGQVRYEVRN